MPVIRALGPFAVLLFAACGSFSPETGGAVPSGALPTVAAPISGRGIIDRAPARERATPCLPIPTNIPVLGEADRPVWANEVAKFIAAGREAPRHDKTSQSGAASWQPLTDAEILDSHELKEVIVERLGGTLVGEHVLDSCQPLNVSLYAYEYDGKPNLGIPLSEEELADKGFYSAVDEASGERVLMKHIMPTDVAPVPRVAEAQVLRLCFDDVIGQRACAFVLVPKSPGPHPLALAFHQTNYEWGAFETLGAIPYNHVSMTYGQELAGRGYLVVMPFQNGYGKGELFEEYQGATEWNNLRVAHLRLAFPRASLVLTEFWQARRAVDAAFSLSARLNIASEHYAVVGHSKGGYNAVVMGALDPRVVSTFANGGRASYPMKGVDGDDNALEEMNTLQKGFVFSWCEWSGYATDFCFYAGKEDEFPVDANVFFPLLLGPGKSFVAGLIEDDRLPGSLVNDEQGLPTRSRWLSMYRLGEELVRVADRRGGTGRTEIVWSGLREPWGIPYLAEHDGDLTALRLFTSNQAVGGRTHGLYRVPGQVAAAIMDAQLFAAPNLNPGNYASAVHLSNGGRY